MLGARAEPDVSPGAGVEVGLAEQTTALGPLPLRADLQAVLVERLVLQTAVLVEVALRRVHATVAIPLREPRGLAVVVKMKAGAELPGEEVFVRAVAADHARTRRQRGSRELHIPHSARPFVQNDVNASAGQLIHGEPSAIQ